MSDLVASNDPMEAKKYEVTSTEDESKVEEVALEQESMTETVGAGEEGEPEEDIPEEQGSKGNEHDEDQAILPSLLCCPIAMELYKDPVVVPTGETMERDLAQDKAPSDKLYPNRALQNLIHSYLAQSGDSFRASWMRLEKSVKQSLSARFENSVVRSLHNAYYCPITMDLMHVPVIDPEGNTFEKVAIENWIRHNHRSPITREPLEISDLYPNKLIEDLIVEELSLLDESASTWVEKWKSEATTSDPEAPMGQLASSASVGSGHPNALALVLSPEELEEIQNRRQRQLALNICLWAVILLSFVLFNFVPEGQLVFLSLIFCCVLCTWKRRTTRNAR